MRFGTRLLFDTKWTRTALIDHGCVHPASVVIQRGRSVVAPFEYTKTLKARRSAASWEVIDPAKVLALVDSGCTVFYFAVEQFGQTAVDLLADARAVLPSDLDPLMGKITAVWSGPGESALPVHADPASQVVLQLEGSKTWRLYDTVERSGPVKDVAETPRQVVRLEPGSILVLRPGEAHGVSIEDSDVHSLHLTLQYWTDSALSRRLVAGDAEDECSHASVTPLVCGLQHADRLDFSVQLVSVLGGVVLAPSA